MFGNIKKCAIFVHYSINDIDNIEKKRTKLVNFCTETLKCDDYEVFIEIGSFEGERKIFDDMLSEFEKGAYSHLIVEDIGQIYKLSYDIQKAVDLTDKIQAMNVTIISVNENRIIEGIESLKQSRNNRIKQGINCKKRI